MVNVSLAPVFSTITSLMDSYDATYLCRRLPTAKAQPTTIIEEELAINIIQVVGEGFENKKEIAKNIQNGYYIFRKLKLIHDHLTVIFTFSARLFFSIQGFVLLFWFFISFFNKLLGFVLSLGFFCDLCGDNT